MRQTGFIFNCNKCTGCNACQIACILENELDFSSRWRQVITYNQLFHPLAPVFHISMACNHCADAPCQKFCPAIAYEKEEKWGSVQINDIKCIGCKYCSWVCPYDAPYYDSEQGIMTKCSLCKSRLEEGLDPACIALCPTGALKLGYFTNPPENKDIPGITPSSIGPALEIIPLRKGRKPPPIESLTFGAGILEAWQNSKSDNQEKITLKNEWTLLLFTMIFPMMVAYYFGTVIGEYILNSYIFFGFGIVNLLLTSWHLGKKIRSWRAVLNWRHSWLSREISGYISFLIITFFTIYIAPELSPVKFLAVFTGLFTLFAMDMVYLVVPGRQKIKLHSAQVLWTGLLYCAISSDIYLMFCLFLLIKFTLFFRRKLMYQSLRTIPAVIRIIFGFLLPPLFWHIELSGLNWLLLTTILIGELSDRIEFYLELNIITPVKQIKIDLDRIISAER